MTFRRVIHRMQFRLEQLFVRGAHYQLLVVAALIGLISVVGGALVLVEEGQAFGGVGGAVWWAFLRLSDPGYLGDDSGMVRRTVSTILTVLGYVVFLGALVAILTQWLQATMRRLESGVTPVARNDHVLILGWTGRTPTIAHELLLSEGRVKRFLRLHGAHSLHLVILAEEVTARLLQELRDRLDGRWNPRQITMRSGNPLRPEHLERADFSHALTIIIPAAEFSDGGPGTTDTRTIKTLLSVSNHPALAGNAERPPVVAEILDARKVVVAERAYSGPIEVIASDALVSRLIAQNVRHRGLSYVYTELLTHKQGCEIYVREADRFMGRPVRALGPLFPRTVLLGIARPRGRSFRALLNPGLDVRVQEGDRLVFVANSYEDTSPPETIATPPAGHGVSTAGHRVPQTVSDGLHRVLVLGWSHKVPALIKEFASYRDEQFALDVVSTVPIERRETQVGRYEFDQTSVHVRHIEADYTVHVELARVEPMTYANIVLIGSDWLRTGTESDARTIVGYLVLQELLEGAPQRPNVLVELLDPENMPLLGHRPGEVIISPQIISHMLAQVALRRELRAVFDELFTAGGAEITFRHPGDYGLAGQEVDFWRIAEESIQRGEIAIGVFEKAESAQSRPQLNPDPHATWRLGDDDEIIAVITSG